LSELRIEMVPPERLAPYARNAAHTRLWSWSGGRPGPRRTKAGRWRRVL